MAKTLLETTLYLFVVVTAPSQKQPDKGLQENTHTTVEGYKHAKEGGVKHSRLNFGGEAS